MRHETRSVEADAQAYKGRMAKAKQFQRVAVDALTLVGDGASGKFQSATTLKTVSIMDQNLALPD